MFLWMWQKAVAIWSYNTSFTEILLLATASSQARGQTMLSRLEVNVCTYYIYRMIEIDITPQRSTNV